MGPFVVSLLLLQDVEAAAKRYCAGCHNNKLKTANFTLQDVAPGDTATWEKALRKIRSGEMPPPGLPRPDASTTAAIVLSLEASLDQAAKARPEPGAPIIHRLNRAEYSNAVRDVLALDLDHASSLPADDSGYGFDNIGSVLSISPLHMEKYMATARRVSRIAVGTARFSPAIEKYTTGRGLATDFKAADSSDELPLNIRGAAHIRRFFPADAEYTILVRARGNPDPMFPPGKLDVRVDGRRAKLFDVAINTAEEAQHTRNYELRLPLKAGMHTVGASFLNDYALMENGVVVRQRFAPPPPSPASVEYILIGGPFQPTGPGETESRRRIFLCRPGEKGLSEQTCAQRIVSTLTRRAYRRPVTKQDIEPLMKFFTTGRRDGGSFESGVEMAIRAMLVSPGFLFRSERSQGRLSDLELASRLSFFLWSSIPDEELLALAERNRLRQNLDKQVRRMLTDEKSKAMVENFTGQWLQLRNVSGWQPDPDKYKQFDESLRRALEQETHLLFGHVARTDQSVLDLINADYTFLNERLARHYGVEGVRGSYFRRVPLAGPERGGILTQGSVLMVTSYPTRTSPVLRGKWILENVLGAPPPPPPPDVPDLADSANKSAKDLRAALEKHRANAACASCHARLDPMGFALENYDGVGTFRKSEEGAEIDASGALPNGQMVLGPGGLKAVLMERREEFVECLSEKLLTYALGRGLEHTDMPVVRQIRRETALGGYKFSALTLAIVNSVPFQSRRPLSQ